MKKILRCRLSAVLLMCVAFFATGNLFAQVCTKSETLNATTHEPATFVCVGDNLIWRTTSFNAPSPEMVRWHIVSDNSGGAKFVTTNSAADLVVPSAGVFNEVLVKMGLNAGSVEIRMSYESNPNATGCASSGVAVTTQVIGTPSVQVCFNDTGCIIGKAVTIIGGGQPPIDLSPYTYTLFKGGVQVGSSNTNGSFCGLAPDDYVVHAVSQIGCPADSPTIHLVNPAFNPVHVTCPLPMTVKSCDYATQTLLNQAYDAWYLGFQYSGGSQPISVIRTGATDYPQLCGGVGHGSIDATDFCKTHDFCASTFTVLPPDVIVPNIPQDTSYKACDLVDRDDLLARIAAYKLGFGVTSGGCDPKVVFDTTVVPTDICLGDITVSGHITDRCDISIPFSRNIHITPVIPVGFVVPTDNVQDACFYKTQDELIAAYVEWIKGFHLTDTNGCKPVTAILPNTLPNLCGGVITVHFTVKDRCQLDKDVTAQFGVRPSTPPVINKCPDGGDLKCNPLTIPSAGVPDVTSACPYKVTPTIVDSHVDCFYKRVITYKVTTDCFPDGVTCDQVYTWKQDKDAPIITGLGDKTVAGGDEDGGLCSPTTTVGGKSFTPPAFKGSSNVSIDFGQVRTGDAPDELLKWTNGTTTAQSDYFEGQCVPQRVLIDGLKKGKHTLYIRHEAVKKQDASRHGYDFLTGWDNAILAAANIGTPRRDLLKNLNLQECDGNWSGAGQDACKGFTTSAKTDIPDVMGNPPNQTGNRNVDDNIVCFESEYGNRTMEMEANSAVSGFKVRFLGYDGSDSKSDFAWYAIDWDSQSTTVELKFAGRMAMGGGSCGYGNCHGAGSIHGNPYHIILEGLDGAGVGQRDNQTKCKRSETCDVNIPVKFDTPTATDCDPATIIPVKDGGEIITTLPDGSVKHCQSWTATDACGNIAHATQCITVVCVSGANFGDLKGLIKTVGSTSKMAEPNTAFASVPVINSFVAYPNPFHDTVSLTLDTNSTERVNLSIYDMLGKQLDQRVTTPEDINNVHLGGGYPTGIYNLILNQATEQRTVRLLKQ